MEVYDINFEFPFYSENKELKTYVFRVFLIFLVAIGVPSLILTTYFLVNTARTQTDVYEDFYSEQIDSFISGTNSFLVNCSEFISIISTSAELQKINKTPYENCVYSYKMIYEAMCAFKNNSFGNVDVSVFIDKSDRVLSTANVIDKIDEYKNNELIYEFLEDGDVFSYKQVGDRLAYITVLPEFFIDTSFVFVFYVDIADLMLLEEDSFIVTPDNEILFDADYADIEKITTENGTKNFYELQDYTVWYEKESYSGLVLGKVFDKSATQNFVGGFLGVALGTFVLSLFLICVLAYLLAVIQSKSVIKLSAQIKKLPGQASVTESNNLFETFSNTLTNLRAQNETYARTIEQNKNIIKDQAVRRLIYNHIPVEYDMVSYLQESHIYFNGNAIVLALLTIRTDFSLDRFNKLSEFNLLIKQLTEEYFIENSLFIGNTILGTDIIAILLDGDKIEREEHRVDDILNHAINIIQAKINISISATISYPADSSEKIYEAFLLMKKQLTKSKNANKVVLVKDDDEKLCFPSTIHSSLLNAMRSREVKLVDEVLQKMYRLEIASNSPDAKDYCFAIVCKVLTDYHESWRDFRISSEDVSKVFSNESTEIRYQKLVGLFTDIINTETEETVAEETDSIAHDSYILGAKRYISAHLKEDISISAIANHLNISSSYFNRIFKLHTNMTPLQYVTYFRISKAKDLLCNTQMNIQDIATEIGYLETRTFIRNFKKIEGATPTEYKNSQAGL